MKISIFTTLDTFMFEVELEGFLCIISFGNGSRQSVLSQVLGFAEPFSTRLNQPHRGKDIVFSTRSPIYKSSSCVLNLFDVCSAQLCFYNVWSFSPLIVLTNHVYQCNGLYKFQSYGTLTIIFLTQNRKITYLYFFCFQHTSFSFKTAGKYKKHSTI